MPRIVVLCCALPLLGLAACGGETTAPPSPSPQPTFDATEPPGTPRPVVDCEDATVTGDPEVRVVISDNSFRPDCLIALGGQALVLRNRGSVVHNWSVEGTQVDMDVGPGEVRRTEPLATAFSQGTHAFFCKYHERDGMTGELTISSAG